MVPILFQKTNAVPDVQCQKCRLKVFAVTFAFELCNVSARLIDVVASNPTMLDCADFGTQLGRPQHIT